MIRLSAYRYDGETSSRQQVELLFSDESTVQVVGDEFQISYQIAEIQSRPKVGKVRAQFIFPDGSLCEVAQHPDLSKVLELLPQKSFQNKVHIIESRLITIIIALVIAIGLLFSIIQYGIPVAAQYVAYKVPVALEESMGEEVLNVFDKFICDESELDDKRQNQLRDYFYHNYYKSTEDSQEFPLRVLFRECGGVGPNAFALPSGIIVFTDEMVNLAEDDNELLGIFAHEVGHVKYRHALRHVLQNSATSLIIILLTGDVGSASSLAATIPTILVQTKFSRDFEAESDDFAGDFLLARRISPKYMADILNRLEEKYGSGESVTESFLSTHPLTKDRVNKFIQLDNELK